VETGPCDLPIEDGSKLTNADFLRKYAYQRPFVVRDATNQNAFRALCQRERILSDWGESRVVLSAANTYSYEKREVSFAHYCNHIMTPQNIKTQANGETIIV
jgi:ribosomal protein L16 Arg81 hydroxylase